MTAFMAPNGKFYVFTKCGQPAVGGFMVTSDANTGAPKNTYSDPAMTIPNPPVMRIGSDGAVQFTLFWDISSSYYDYITADASGAVIDQQLNYPVTNPGTDSPPVTVVVGSTNFAQNEQYAFWLNGTAFDNDTLPIGTTETANMWQFTRSNADAVIAISRFTLPAGYSGVPFSPSYAYRYQVTTASADAVQDHGQRYEDVNTLSNQIVFRANYMATNVIGSSASISLYCRQNFGSGGSAEVVNIIATYTINDTPAFYPSSFAVPDVSTKVIGVGSFLEIGLRLNPSQIQDVLLMDEQFQKGIGTGIRFPYITQNLQYERILSDVLSENNLNTGTDIIGLGSLIQPPIPGGTLTNYLLSLSTSSNISEYLIGWEFRVNPRQLGNSISSVANGQYVADQTIVVSDGDGIVSQSSTIKNPLQLTVVTPNKKFGIFQIIETATSSCINNTIVSLGARLSISSSTSTFKMAILGWSGTPGLETRKCVSSWNAAGSDPSLATNWSFASSIFTFTIEDTSNPILASLNTQSMATFTSYGVLVWNDDAALSTGIIVNILEASLTNAVIAKFNSFNDFGKTLLACERYIYRSYNVETADGTATSTNSYGFMPLSGVSTIGGANAAIYPATMGGGGNVTSSSGIACIDLPIAMYSAPTITIYNPSTTNVSGSGYLYILSTSIPTGGSLLVSASVQSINEKQFSIIYEPTTVIFGPATIELAPIIYINFTAYALLGV